MRDTPYPRRESLTSPVNGVEETWDYLILYSIDDKILARSEHAHPESTIVVTYEGIDFISIRGLPIYIDYNSLLNAIK